MIATAVPGTALAAPPSNDRWQDTPTLPSLPFQYTVSTLEATLQAGEPQPTCGVVGATVWYRIDVTGTFLPQPLPTLSVNTYGSNFNTILAVYEAADLGAGVGLFPLTQVACNDEGLGFTLRSAFTFTPQWGKTYLFQAGGKTNDRGTLVFNLGVPPDNDDIAAALGIEALPFPSPTATAGPTSTVGATLQAGEGASCGFSGSTVWYRHAPSAYTHISADTFGSTFDTVIHVYALGADGSFTLVGCNDNAYSGALRSFIAFAAYPGNTYYLQVGGMAGRSGSLTFNLKVAEVAANDDFEAAELISSPTFHGAINGLVATKQASEPAPCAMGRPTVWYRYQATTTSITAETLGSSFDTSLAISTGSGSGALSLLACNDNFSGTLQSSLSFTPVSGTVYYFQAGAKNTYGLPGDLVFDLHPPENNDLFAAATEVPLDSLPFERSVSSSSASTEAGEPAACGTLSATLWWKLAPAADMSITVDTSGSGFPLTVGIYRGTAITSLTNVACKSSSVNTASFEAEAGGDPYYLQVGGGGSPSSGTLRIKITGFPLPLGDDFAEAIDVGSIPTSTARDLSGATTESGEPTSSCGRNTLTIWFKYTSTSQRTLTADTFGSDANTVLAVFTGTALTNLTSVGCNNDHSYPSTDDSAVTFVTAPGTTTYYFQVSTFSGTSFLMSLREEAAPSNDAFASAKEVTATAFPTYSAYSDEVRTIAATTEAGEPTSSDCGTAQKTVWYRFAPTETTLVSLNTVGSNFDTILYIYSGTALESLGYNGVCNNDLSPWIDFRSRIEFLTQGGTTYYLRAGGASGQGGILKLNLRGWQVPENDLLSNAVTITALPFEAAVTNTYGASREIGEPHPGDTLGYCGNNGRTVWYKYTTPTDTVQNLSVDTFPDSTFNTVVAVYRGAATATVDDLTFVECNNDHHFGSGRRSSFMFRGVTDTVYYFQVGGFYALSGDLRFRAQQIVEAAVGDNMGDRVDLTNVTPTAGVVTHTNETFSTTLTATTASREPEAGEGQPCGGMAATVWYTFTPNALGEYLVTATPESDFNAVLAVYVEDPTTGRPAQPALRCSQSSLPGPIAAAFQASADVTYWFQVGGLNGDSGEFTLKLKIPL